MKQIIFTVILIFAFCFAAFAQTNEISCPKYSIIFLDKFIIPDKPATIIIQWDKDAKTTFENLEYIWTSSSGKISQGQGTSKIEFLATKEDYNTNITFTAKIIGLPKTCNNLISEVFPIIPSLREPHPIDIYGKQKLMVEKARLDNAFIALNENDSYRLIIDLEFDKNDRRNYKISRLRNIYEFIKFRKHNLSQVLLLISNGDAELTRLWIAYPKAKISNIKVGKYTIVRAEELNQKIKELFPKK